MAFDEIDDFLGRNNDPKIKNLLDKWKVYYDKIVYVGGEIFNDILKKENLGKDDSLPLIMLFRNAVELIDSISILVNNSSSEPARILLRTLLETSFYCEYILEKDTQKRSMAFLICHYHQKLDFNYKLQHNTQQGKQFLSDLKTDKNIKNYQFVNQTLLEKAIKNLEELLSLDLYKEAETEYQRIDKQYKYRKPKWYEFYGGPTSIAKLAKHLKQVGLYHILYSSLSKSTHGNHIIDGFISPGKKEDRKSVV